MKRLSLQWRVALMTFFLLALSCVTMKTLLCSSGHASMDSIGNYMLHYGSGDSLEIHIDVPETEQAALAECFTGEFNVELSEIKHDFCVSGWYFAAAVTVLGGAVA